MIVTDSTTTGELNCPKSRVSLSRSGVADPDDLPGVVNPVRRATGAAERPQRLHTEVCPPNERKPGCRRRLAAPDDDPVVVNVRGHAVCASQRAQVLHASG